jgi:broad specificity phosphatase PhoE
MASRSIYLLRHGETAWNREGRQQGQLDSPLTETGIQQAQFLGKALAKLLVNNRDGLVVEASPLGRARMTASLICSELAIPVEEIVTSNLLCEHHLGEWQGLTYSEIDAAFPGTRQWREADKWNYIIRGGESYFQASARARKWLDGCAHRITIAVTHEMMSRNIQGAYAGLSPNETLRRSHRHGQVYHLAGGRLELIACK